MHRHLHRAWKNVNKKELLYLLIGFLLFVAAIFIVRGAAKQWLVFYYFTDNIAGIIFISAVSMGGVMLLVKLVKWFMHAEAKRN